MKQYIPTYFLGGTSPIGFQSKFVKIIQKDNYFTYILKGGPGTGKSTLMKKIAEHFKDNDTEIYYCSSDIKSVDAVVINDKKAIIVDGTSPHVFEANYPAISQEIVNLGDFWDKKKISEHSLSVRHCFEENAKYHSRAKRFVNALASLNSDIYSIAQSSLLTDKLMSFTDRLVGKITPKPSSKIGRIEYKQLSAITASGYNTHPINPDYQIYLIKDDHFAGGDIFLKTLADQLVESGVDIIVSECTMLQENTYEHILIPELNIAFITSNFFNNLNLTAFKTINFSRFYNKELLQEKKQRIAFNEKACLDLYNEAVTSINIALDIHNKLEEFYIRSLDFSSLTNKCNELIAEIEEK